jgi:hypothetical protein
MLSQEPLPQPLDRTPFSVAEAKRAGVRHRRLYRPDLARPFHGVRSASAETSDARTLCEAFLPRLRTGQFFSHTTSARLQGIPLPLRLAEDRRLHVSVLAPGRAVRTTGAVGHQLIARTGLVVLSEGLPIASPLESWCQLATLLTVDELIDAGDFLVGRPSRNTHGMWAAMAAAVRSDDRPCVGRLRDAFAEVRPGVRSPGETRLRLLLTRAGLPEPLLNEVIRDQDGRFVAECDLVYRAQRLVLEYEGDYHRTDARTFRNDIVRRERLDDLGYRTLRVTVDDLRQRPEETVARVQARLTAASPA